MKSASSIHIPVITADLNHTQGLDAYGVSIPSARMATRLMSLRGSADSVGFRSPRVRSAPTQADDLNLVLRIGNAGNADLTAAAVAAAQAGINDIERVYTGPEVERFSDALATAPKPLRLELVGAFDAARQAFGLIAKADPNSPGPPPASNVATRESNRHITQAALIEAEG